MVFIRHGEPINNEQDVNIPVDYTVPEVGKVHELFSGCYNLKIGILKEKDLAKFQRFF